MSTNIYDVLFLSVALVASGWFWLRFNGLQELEQLRREVTELRHNNHMLRRTIELIREGKAK